MKRKVTEMRRKGLFSRSILMGALAAMLIAGPGCAYFNSFYLARKNFNDGERFRKRDNEVRMENKKYYNNAVEQASIILQDYKKSRYVDDCLYIIGMSYFHMRDFVRAKTKYDELFTAFPNSEFAEDARFYRAQCFMELDRSDEARVELSDLMSSGSKEMKGRAGLMLAEINNRGERWDEMVKIADSVIESSPERATLQEALLYRADGLYSLEKFEDAVAAYEKLRSGKLTPRLTFRVNSRLAQCLAKLKRYDESLKLLETLQGRGNMSVFAPGIRLEMGKILEMKGDTGKAVDVYSKMAADFPDSIASREAWYRVGIITLRDLTKTQDARDAFVKATDKIKIPEIWFTDAIEKSAQIDSLKSRTDRIEKLKEKPDERAHERFLVAELLTWSLDHADAALEQYRAIMEEAPKSEFAVRSEFLTSLADLDKNGTRTEEAERDVMSKIVDKYPDSHFSQELKVRLGIIDFPQDVKMFTEAEDARAKGKGGDVYIPLYQAVVDSFPEAKIGYQARFLMAWCYEHEIKDRDKALEIYKGLADLKKDEYNRDFVDLAADKLKFIEDEKKILDESKKNIAFYESEIDQLATGEPRRDGEDIAAESGAVDSEFLELRKIRARNARIRSRYYSY